MVTEKQRANLAKGRQRGIKRKNTVTPRGSSWAELIRAYGETPAPTEFAKGLAPGATWKAAVVAAAYKHAVGGNAAILRELMERDEGKVKDETEHSGEITLRVVYEESDNQAP